MQNNWKGVYSGQSGYVMPSGLPDEEGYLDITPSSPYEDTVYNESTVYNVSEASFPTNESVDYIYDFEDSINNIPVEEITLVALVYGLTLVLGVLGNSLVIFTIIRVRRMQSITNIFLTSLASADLLLLFICVPIKVSRAHFSVNPYYASHN